MRIIIVGYYYLIEGFLYAANALKANSSWTIDFFPGLFYNQHKQDLLQDHLTNFIEGNIIDYDDKVIYDNKNLKKADLVLWWNLNIGIEKFSKIQEDVECTHILYSNYDPVSQYTDPNNAELVKLFNVVFSSCKRSVEYYKGIGCYNAYHILSGFDKTVHNYEENDDYKCDISFVLNNLYNYGSDYKKINRENFLKELIEKTDYNIHIYGSPQLKALFPDNYKGECNYNNTKYVFSNSKINISTHISMDGDTYINERSLQILGSKGLLLIDNVGNLNEILDVEKECVVIDEDNIIEQIDEIMNNYDKYEEIKENGYKKAIQELTWTNWSFNIKKNLSSYIQVNKTVQEVKKHPILPKLISPNEKEYELIYLLKATYRSKNELSMYLNDLAYICENSEINVNDAIEKFFKEIKT